MQSTADCSEANGVCSSDRMPSVLHNLNFTCLIKQACHAIIFFLLFSDQLGAQNRHIINMPVSSLPDSQVETASAESSTKRPRLGSPSKQPVHEFVETDIARGAEGAVTLIPFIGRKAIRKVRFPKRYRHPQLDAKLTSRRIAQEARMLLRLRKAGIRVPAVYCVDMKMNEIIMQYIEGSTLKSYLHNEKCQGEQVINVMKETGRVVGIMHGCGIVHGDLTTGNAMVSSVTDGGSDDLRHVTLIDFGLSSGNASVEDKAVDLYVFERAVISAHSEQAGFLNDAFLEGYGNVGKGKAVLRKLEEVRARGRKRDMTG